MESSVGLYYNKDIIEKAGVEIPSMNDPWTWDEFYEVCEKIKNVIPEMCNTFVNNLKMTSVLNVIGVSELFLMAKTAGGAYYKYFESYIVISIIYFIMCFVFNRLFAVIEKKLQGRSDYELATEYLEND